MRKNLFVLLVLGSVLCQTLWSQQKSENQQKEQETQAWMSIYRATPTIINDLIHTRIDITPIFETQKVNGKVWITLKPHFLPTDSLTLDAKTMDIASVQLIQEGETQNLTYKYENDQIKIKLPRLFTREEDYTVYIVYTAKPNEKKVKGSAAITSDKGFYFINPKGEDPDKPTQIWTQGETEASSCWFPTIEQTTQKSTQELLITVPKKFTTLSNGILTTQTNNGDLRTDYWVMDKPHSPYLFFVAAGEYSVVSDKYKDIYVDYFVEKEYAPFAKRIFGMTPDMIQFFETKLGVDYPWSKYAQIVGRDYVSGAMENTTATLHMQEAQQNGRQLKDGNGWESVIAHELFHHWFGDLVTAESWSNLTLNESFADYSEYLWYEHRYGSDMAKSHLLEARNSYLRQIDKHGVNLVRYHYADKEDMFDVVSYNKGGSILHMLRNYLGDEVFFESLKRYLTKNQYKSAEADQLRLAFEEVSGQDLNWFFNQWYFGAGHPNITIQYADSARQKQVFVSVKQSGATPFLLPCKVVIHYPNGEKKQQNMFFSHSEEKFTVPYNDKGLAPVWISVDADNTWLCVKNDNLSTNALIYQLMHGDYIDRTESIEVLQKSIYTNPEVRRAFFEVLNNGFFRTKLDILNALQVKKTDSLSASDWKLIAEIADNKEGKEHSLVQASAIDVLALHPKAKKYSKIFEAHLMDSSYSVAGSSLSALYKVDTLRAISFLPELQKDAKDNLLEQMLFIMCDQSKPEYMTFVASKYNQASFRVKAYFSLCLISYLSSDKADAAISKKVINALYNFYVGIPEQYAFLRAGMDGLISANTLESTKPSLQGEVLIYFRNKFKDYLQINK